MVDPLDEMIEDEFFPGSKRRRRDPRPQPVKREVDWDSNPRHYAVNGEQMEFFTINALAVALDRKLGTIRMWIRSGKMPDARYKLPPPRGRAYGLYPAAGVRLWTRPQIEAIVKIAAEEGILGVAIPADFSKTRFTQRVTEAMR